MKGARIDSRLPLLREITSGNACATDAYYKIQRSYYPKQSLIQNRVSSQVPPMATSAWPITHAALAEVLAVTDNSKLAREMMPAQ